MINESKSGQQPDGNSKPGTNSNSQELPQKRARSDQEQEGRQNPAGDTRDVDREPVARPDSTQTSKK